ncbi:hypothetical protein C2G38_2081915 [Gigaspora rosea]|uniref:Phosphatidylglycerol/phosphatidylinositol transfer protein n=1 Tax=Gigaspora rosea TaxID=44941 RepID=A0A397VF73_9GLOM|nr:hypothetical protein C2G38_2081915 [Gigaspora rosea]
MQLRTFFVFVLVIISSSVNAIPTHLGERTSDHEPHFPLSLTVIPDNLVHNTNTSFTISTQLDKRTSGYGPCLSNRPGLSVTTNPANLVPNTKTEFTVSGSIDGQFTQNTKIEINLYDEFENWLYGFYGEGCPCDKNQCPCSANQFTIKVNAEMKDKYSIIVDLFLSAHAGIPDACATAHQ